MKRKILMIFMFVIALSLFSLQSAFAADDIESGNYNGLDWRITSDHELIIGSAGQTQYLNHGDDNFPWYKRTSITAVKFEGKVIGQDLNHLFAKCYGIETIDLTGLDTSKATDMSRMFNSCLGLTSLDVSGLDTRNVADMSGMFAFCSSLTSIDVSGFDTHKVTRMNAMFNGCNSLTSLDVSGFDTSKVTDMTSMLGCELITSLDISNFDMSNVTAADHVVEYATSLKNLKTPKNLKVDSNLPVTMYDLQGKEYTTLPKNLTGSISLYNEPTHQWQLTKTKPATCTANGYKTYVCSSCEGTKTETVTKTGHTWDAGKITTRATCTAAGIRTFTCKKCHATKTKSIAKTGHSWDSGTIAKKAKYYSPGIKTYLCTRCGETRSQAIPVLDDSKVKPARAKFKAASVSGNKLTVKWKRIAKKTKGYQVAVKDKKTGKQKYYKVKQSKKKVLSKTIKKLKKGRTYAVRIRAYNKIGDEYIYGPWSKVKQGKI